MAAEIEVQLRDILIFARHGVLPEEQITGNQFRVSVRLRFDASVFDASADNLSSTISYAEVFEILKQVMSIPVKLLETVAVRFSKEVINKWDFIKSGEIEIVKTVPPIPDMIGEAGIRYQF